MGTTGGGVWKTENYGITWVPVTDGQIADRIDRRHRRVRLEPERRLRRHRQRSDSIERDSRPRRLQVDRRGPDVAARRAEGRRPDRPAQDPSEESRHRVRRGASAIRSAGDPSAACTARRTAARRGRRCSSSTIRPASVSVAINWSNPNEIYAGAWRAQRKPWTIISGGPAAEGGVYKTTDGGDHWTRVEQRIPRRSDRQGVGGRRAVEPEGRLRAGRGDGREGRALSHRPTAARRWTLVNSSQSLRARPFYFNKVFVNPKDENEVYVTELGVPPVDRRRQDVRQRRHTARRQPRRLVQSRQPEDLHRDQRRRRQHHAGRRRGAGRRR